MSDERRCLVVDGHPLVRLGVRRLLADRFEIEEATCGDDALEMLTEIQDFDVAIIDLGRAAQNGADKPKGTAVIRALREASPGLGIVAHGSRPERHAATEAIKAGATAYVAKSSPAEALDRAVDAAAESETFVDPAAENGDRPQGRADQAPAPDPADDRRRQLDLEHGQAPRAQLRDRPHPHQGRPRPPLGARPRSRGGHRPPLLL